MTSQKAYPKLVLTIGHSTHPIDEFIDILHTHDVGFVADVRTIPRSRHNPQFNKAEVARELRSANIGYEHISALGGLRKTIDNSLNTEWRNASFRGFADYMQTTEFADGLDELLEFASDERVALMCAEAVPWRCHRSLIADALLVRGIEVQNIMSRIASTPHILTSFIRVSGITITYPSEMTKE
ncbi:MAG: DUF488 domain-containing protein [Pyrinomonadaceae bacterium]